MSIEKYVERLYDIFSDGYFVKIKDKEVVENIDISVFSSFLRTSLEEYGREVIDKCIEALPPLSTDHEWNWSEGYNQYYLEAHKKLNNLK